jgi:hypothetical protein
MFNINIRGDNFGELLDYEIFILSLPHTEPSFFVYYTYMLVVEERDANQLPRGQVKLCIIIHKIVYLMVRNCNFVREEGLGAAKNIHTE